MSGCSAPSSEQHVPVCFYTSNWVGLLHVWWMSTSAEMLGTAREPNKAELMGFLSLDGYFRCFVASFSSVMATLINLLKAEENCFCIPQWRGSLWQSKGTVTSITCSWCSLGRCPLSAAGLCKQYAVSLQQGGEEIPRPLRYLTINK